MLLEDEAMRRARFQPGLLLLLLSASLLGASLLALPIPLKPKGPNGAIHKQIEQLEQQWHTALLAEDNAAIANMLGESYIGIGPDGTIASRAEELQARNSGKQRTGKLDVEDEKIRIYGTTAVVTSKVRVEGLYAGEPITGEYRYTRVWSLTRGQWHIVSFEASRINDAAARKY